MTNRWIGPWIVAAAFLCASAARPQDAAPKADPHAADLYASRCAACHDRPDGRAPPRPLLATRSPAEVAYALTNGAMRQQAEGLSAAQIAALAIFLTGRAFLPPPDPAANLCAARPRLGAAGNTDWPGWSPDARNARYQADPGFAAADIPRLKVKWAFDLPGLAGSPVVAGGRLFVASRLGRIFALDAATGCTFWSFDAGAPVRGAIAIADLPGGRHGAFFGDHRAVVHALDADTGAELWRATADDYPTARILGSVVVHAGRVYAPVTAFDEMAASDPAYPCCRFRGKVAALDAATGARVWTAFTIPDDARPTRLNSAGTQMYGPAGAGVWAAPTIDAKRGLLYAATGDAYTSDPTDASNAIIAFDLATGRRVWATQVLKNDAWIYLCSGQPVGNCPSPQGPDSDFSSPAALTTMPSEQGSGGKDILTAAAKSGAVYAFDPDSGGRMLWRTSVGVGSAVTPIWGPASDGAHVYAATPGAGLEPGTVGGLTALDLATGAVAWHTPAPAPVCAWGAAGCLHAQPGAVALIPGAVFAGALDGHVRAYGSTTGAILWDLDAGGSFPAVNGGRAEGGNIDGAAITIAEGALFINAGNATLLSPRHGEAVLAVTVDGR